MLTDFDLNFILPLRRNFTDIDYLFEDVKLRAEEETTFLHLMNEKKKNIEQYKEELPKFGKIANLSNRYVGGETIYLMWILRKAKLVEKVSVNEVYWSFQKYMKSIWVKRGNWVRFQIGFKVGRIFRFGYIP